MEEQQRQMLEQAEAEAAKEEGILSNSTLAALQKQNGSKSLTSAKAPAAPVGPLVGYGSDDDEDES